MELVASNRVASLLDRGIYLYHVCYEVPDLFAAMEALMAKGASVISDPKPAPLFHHRRVTFLDTPLGLVELLEERPSIPVDESEKSRKPEPPPRETIAIAATFTAEPLKDSLDFWMEELGLPFGVAFAPYNQVFQQLLDPASVLARNESGIDVVLARFQDWGNAEDETIACDEIERNVRQFAQALESAATRGTYIVCVCPVPPDTKHGDFYRRMEDLLASESNRIANLQLIGSEDSMKTYPVPRFDDPHGEAIGHIPYTPLFFTAIGALIARRIHAALRDPYKVIVLDCDNTLWQGVCAEDGASGVAIGAPHLALQRFMIARQQAGKLLCLCSKNREADVLAVFDERPEMLLGREHLVSWPYPGPYPGAKPRPRTMLDKPRCNPNFSTGLQRNYATRNGFWRGSRPGADTPGTPPRPTSPPTPKEQLLAEIWIDVLGLDRVGIHDNFFRLGVTRCWVLRSYRAFATRLPSDYRCTCCSNYPPSPSWPRDSMSHLATLPCHPSPPWTARSRCHCPSPSNGCGFWIAWKGKAPPTISSPRCASTGIWICRPWNAASRPWWRATTARALAAAARAIRGFRPLAAAMACGGSARQTTRVLERATRRRAGVIGSAQRPSAPAGAALSRGEPLLFAPR
uniref:FkbH-like domain-containing protein n=1 Tax=Candidatus Kentrum sp. LFY TaxID=2126342 RepID=A0A450UMG1_9GAMM|nr:MAG: FkbH-like domain-containing protein [Candidatus Kentron sp. LFY]